VFWNSKMTLEGADIRDSRSSPQLGSRTAPRRGVRAAAAGRGTQARSESKMPRPTPIAHDVESVTLMWRGAPPTSRTGCYHVEWCVDPTSRVPGPVPGKWVGTKVRSNMLRKKGLVPGVAYAFRVKEEAAAVFADCDVLRWEHPPQGGGAPPPPAPTVTIELMPNKSGMCAALVQWAGPAHCAQYEVQVLPTDGSKEAWVTLTSTLRAPVVCRRIRCDRGRR